MGSDGLVVRREVISDPRERAITYKDHEPGSLFPRVCAWVDAILNVSKEEGRRPGESSSASLSSCRIKKVKILAAFTI